MIKFLIRREVKLPTIQYLLSEFVTTKIDLTLHLVGLALQICHEGGAFFSALVYECDSEFILSISIGVHLEAFHTLIKSKIINPSHKSWFWEASRDASQLRDTTFKTIEEEQKALSLST